MVGVLGSSNEGHPGMGDKQSRGVTLLWLTNKNEQTAHLGFSPSFIVQADQPESLHQGDSPYPSMHCLQ